MCQEKSEEEIAQNILKSIEREYGFIPVVNQVLSERPDLFIPSANVGRSVFDGKGELEKKFRHLAALSAAVALGAEHCMNVQMQLAAKFGASKNEILETMQIAGVMSMTHAQSYAFRKYKEMFP
ncbi:MAG: carboxymuconolactone decarboxylase family protein [Methanomassiliicoccaceae archaeon]|jgi:alkylhydroperoxidase/carboxymuconolactone decarboxylase family protein YurZ|nr:carboxymuconolactone decarboxylase family protein [Methanomassiliicoccaceae archaeon]